MNLALRPALPRNSNVSRPALCHGFTLIELLVTIAVIAILAALLLPGLAGAKKRVQTTACLNNLKQLQICWHLYAVDNHDQMPLNASVEQNGIWRSTPDSWIGSSSAPHDRDTKGIEQGLLYKYDINRNVKLYRCAMDLSTVVGTTLPRTRTYSLNDELGNPEPSKMKKVGEVQHPSTMFAFLDENEDSNDDAHFLVWAEPDDRWVNMPTDRHNRGGTFSFVDGHAEFWKWKWSKDFKNKKTYYKRAENQQDLQDLRKLQRAAR